MSEAIVSPAIKESKPTKPKTKAGRKKPPWARLLIATFLGYIATVLVSGALTSLLPISRAEATFMSLLIAGLVYVLIFIYVFAVSTWQKGLYVLLGLCLAGAGVLAVTRWGLV